jgi:acyl carrier protein
MERKEIQERIVKILKSSLPELAERELTEESTVNEDKGLDSMTFTWIMCQIEDEFSVTIPQKKWRKLSKLGDLISAVEQELA